LLRAIIADQQLRLHLIVSGMHLLPTFGQTIRHVEADGFTIGARIEMLIGSDTSEAIAKSMGLGVIGFAQSFSTFCPDILVVYGDRFEMHAAALAALPFKLPVAHVAGGDVTEGAIDDSLRHSMTKLSHLHFVALEEQSRRILQMGEEPWRIFKIGQPVIDQIQSTPRLSLEELQARFGLPPGRPFLLVTYHPVTLEFEDTERQIREFLTALDRISMPVLFTAPNADTSGHLIASAIQSYVASHPESRLVANMGTMGYFSAMQHAAAMVGNSSSGIVEAASFRLPVANVGNRQQGRLRGRNVIDCGYSSAEIEHAVRQAISPRFRASLHDLTNPYGEGGASVRMAQELKSVALDDKLLRKRFVMLRETPSAIDLK